MGYFKKLKKGPEILNTIGLKSKLIIKGVKVVWNSEINKNWKN